MKSFDLLLATTISSTLLFASCGSGVTTEEKPTETAEEASAPAGTFEIDTAASVVEWSGTLVGVYTHTGTVNLTSGSFTVRDGQVIAGSFTADLTTIQPTDENYDAAKGSTPEKLVGHLSSADFFDVANFPTATFIVKGTDTEGKVVGELTVRGVTDNEILENVSYDEATGTATASLTFDRQKYGVAWAHPVKDMVLEDAIKLTVEVKVRS